MPYLSPPTLTRAEQQALLRASSAHPRDHLIISVALGTGLRLAEIVGLDVGDVFTADGRLTEAERDAIHKAAGPAKASKFARTLQVAAARSDEAAVKAIMKAAQTQA